MTPDTQAGLAGMPGQAPARSAGRICVIADDLTGAADSGVAFVRPGAEVILELDAREPACGQSGGRVTIVDTDTREASHAGSDTTVRALAARTGPRDHLLKKIDSLLRGQVATELAALRGALPGRLLIVAPAVPALGRVTVDGIVRTQQPQARSADGIRLAAQLGGPARVIGLADVRDGARLARSLAAARSAGQLAACDAATDQDLDEIVAAGLALGTPVLWAGAAGLAAALARALLGVPGSELAQPTAPPRASAPLAIVGSHSPAAGAQVRELLASGVQGISLRPGDLLAMTEPDRVRFGADLSRASAAAPTVVWLDGEGPGDHAAPPAIAGALGELCAAAVAAARVVIAAGGATARAVLVPSGVAALALLGEVEPGAVLSRAVPAPAMNPRHALHVITKSGSFGDAATLLRLVTAITQPEGTG